MLGSNMGWFWIFLAKVDVVCVGHADETCENGKDCSTDRTALIAGTYFGNQLSFPCLMEQLFS